MQLDRRSFLRSGVLGVASLGLTGLSARGTLASDSLTRGIANQEGGYGPLKPTASRNTGENILELPDGFQYNVFGKTGEKMSDGLITPGAHDGMAAFSYRGRIRLIRNHETRSHGKSFAPTDVSYDPTATGGTTTLEIDPETRELVRHYGSLSGTIVNCAGGPTPWGTWITCEETTVGTNAGQVYHKDDTRASYEKDHGYCFEVSALKDGFSDPVPLKAMGRFVHEAIAVDPSTGIIYETEDRGSAGFYRFLPDVPTQLREGGRLEIARIKGKPGYDTRRGQKPMQPLEVEWVEIKDADPRNATEKAGAVLEQGLADGAATFGRLEGCWYGNGFIYLNSTDGGDAKKGQVWRYRPMGQDRGELVLLFESPSAEVLDAPDNLCVSPRGGLAICEDGGGTNYLRGLTQDGRIFDFARNALNDSEFAGVCYSPDGHTMFLNIQSPGLTMAVWGPWERGGL